MLQFKINFLSSTVICFQLQTNFSTKEDTDYFIDQGKNSTMFNCWYVIVIALSIYHETNAGKLTHQCTAAQGRCAPTKDSTCERSFGSGWTANGSCCRRKPCCVYFQCEDIPSDSVLNGIVTVKERDIGSTAMFSCFEGFTLVGNEYITCTPHGWNGSISFCIAE